MSLLANQPELSSPWSRSPTPRVASIPSKANLAPTDPGPPDDPGFDGPAINAYSSQVTGGGVAARETGAASDYERDQEGASLRSVAESCRVSSIRLLNLIGRRAEV